MYLMSDSLILALLLWVCMGVEVLNSLGEEHWHQDSGATSQIFRIHCHGIRIDFKLELTLFGVDDRHCWKSLSLSCLIECRGVIDACF
jgi:hypothetical protein